jgi:hypothetical protein
MRFMENNILFISVKIHGDSAKLSVFLAAMLDFRSVYAILLSGNRVPYSKIAVSRQDEYAKKIIGQW